MQSTTSKGINVSLAQLRPGKIGVVNARVAAAPVEGLVKSIDAHGLILPLLVRPNGSDTYDVIDGNRRLAALGMIAKRDKLKPTDIMVPCVPAAEDTADPAEVSMIVNTDRVALHPVDQFECFAHLVKQGASVEDVAKRHGLKVAEVRQALALARMAPAVRDAWRAGKISAEVAEAFTVTEDHKAQEHALKGQGRNSPWHVRRALLGDAEDLGAILKFVGRDAYEKAGGEVNATLFSNEREVAVSDVAKLRELGRQKLTDKCVALVKQGWNWAVLSDEAPKDWMSWRRIAEGKYSKEQMAALGCVVRLGWNGIDVTYGIAKPGEKVPTPKAKSTAKASGKASAAPAKPDVSKALEGRLYAQAHSVLRKFTPHDLADLHRIANEETRKQLAAALQKAFDREDYFRNVSDKLCLAALKEMGEKADLRARPKKEAIARAVTKSKEAGWLPPQLRVPASKAAR